MIGIQTSFSLAKGGRRSALTGAKITGAFFGVGILFLFLLLLKNPSATAAAAADGLRLAAFTVLPSTFPYMVLSGLLSRSALSDFLGRTVGKFLGRLFSLPPSCAATLLMGFLSGFPVGAKCAADLYLQGGCTKEEAERLLALCNFCGPPFILGATAGFLGSPLAGLALFLCQTGLLCLYGVSFRFRRRKRGKAPSTAGGAENAENAGATARSAAARSAACPLSLAFYEAVRAACPSMLQIGGFVVFFSILGGLLDTLAAGGIPAFPAPFWTVVRGLLEISSGTRAAALAGLSAGGLRFGCFCAGLAVVWSGFSVHMQVSAFALPAGLSMREYYLAHLLLPLPTALAASLLLGFLP